MDYKINSLAVFSDETESYRFPAEPTENDTVKIKLRTAKDDIDAAYMVSDNKKHKMKKTHSNDTFDFYWVTMPPDKNSFSYYFALKKGNKTFYYSKVGLSLEILPYADFRVIKNFLTPQWSRGTVMYQIYVDRFCNGDSGNNVKNNEYTYLGLHVKEVKNWSRFPAAEDIRNFYGGDLQGVMDKLDYLKALGVDTIYLNPVFVSPSNHKYDIQDYDHIDPHIGKIVDDGGEPLSKNDYTCENATMYRKRTTSKKNLEASDKLFENLISTSHEKGMKILLDGVYNHCGAFNKWLDKEQIYEKSGYAKGAYYHSDSPYRNYFIWGDEKKTAWPKNNTYCSWWGLPNHPKLNYEKSPRLVEHIIHSAEKWIKPPYNADGWRIDVAADLGQSAKYNHNFWRKFRRRIKKANPNCIILAEHYGDANDWLDGTQWDTIMNYDAFMEPVSYFFTGMEKHSDSFDGKLLNNGKAFANAMVQKMARLPRQSLFSSMNQLSNHDHSRFLTRTNMTVGRVSTLGNEAADDNINTDVFREAVLMQFTWVGSPTMYYGDEAGVTGWTDPDNRRTYPWGSEDTDLIEYHKKVIELRKQYKEVFSEGSTMFLNEDTGIIGYARFNDKCRVLVLFNNNEEEREIEVPVWRTGAAEKDLFKLIFSSRFEKNIEERYYKNITGTIKVHLNATEGVVIADEYQNYL